MAFQTRRPRSKKLQSELLSCADTSYETPDLPNDRPRTAPINALTASREDGSMPPISTIRPSRAPEGAFSLVFHPDVHCCKSLSKTPGLYFRGFPFPLLGSVELRSILRFPPSMKSQSMVSSWEPTSTLRTSDLRIKSMTANFAEMHELLGQRSGGKPFCLVTGHYGHWELAAAMLGLCVTGHTRSRSRRATGPSSGSMSRSVFVLE